MKEWIITPAKKIERVVAEIEIYSLHTIEREQSQDIAKKLRMLNWYLLPNWSLHHQTFTKRSTIATNRNHRCNTEECLALKNKIE